MHESGMIRRLIEVARQEATQRGGTLRGIDVRLGALAGGDEAHLREHLEIELARLGISQVTLHIVSEPMRPTGIEITGIEVAE